MTGQTPRVPFPHIPTPPEPWQTAETIGTGEGVSITFHRETTHLAIGVGGMVVRLRPDLLRTIAHIIATAADDIEAEGRLRQSCREVIGAPVNIDGSCPRCGAARGASCPEQRG